MSSKANSLRQAYERLARLEDAREEARLSDRSTAEIDEEMRALRLYVQDINNRVCSLVEAKNEKR